MATTILFLLENLQPPVFEIASYLCGDRIEASAGHRALFILPNSFVGMLGRYNGTKFDRRGIFAVVNGAFFDSVDMACVSRKKRRENTRSFRHSKEMVDSGDNRIWSARLYYLPIDQAERNFCYLSKLRHDETARYGDLSSMRQ